MRLVNNQKSKLALIPLLFLIIILIIHIAYFIISLFKNKVLWWDQSVYILIGRYFFSLGKEGLFESVRPLVWPFILGFTWKMGFNDILMSRLLSFIFTIGAALLVFLITRELFDEESALLSSGLFLINYLFLFYEQTGLTSIPSVFFALMGLYSLLRIMMKMIKNTMGVLKALFVGILIGIATMTRFTQGIVMIIIILFFIYNLIKARNNTISSDKINNRTKNRTLLYTILYVILGFLIITTPYLIWNYVAYKDPLHTLKLASEIIRRTPPKKTLFYYWIILLMRIETYFWLIGIFYFFKKEIMDKKRFVLFFNILLPLSFIIYHSTIGFKTTRFLLVCLPYIIIPSGFGIKTIREKTTDYLNRLFYRRRKRKGSEKRKGKRRSKTTNNSLLNQSIIITTTIIIVILTLLIIENIILLNKITRYYGNNIVQKQQEEMMREIREIKIKELTSLSNKIVLDNKESVITIGVSSPVIALALTQKESDNLMVNYRIPIYYPSFEDFLSVINKTNESNENNKKPNILLIQEKDVIPTTITRASDKEFRDYFFKTIRSCYEEKIEETNNEEASKEEINKANKVLLFWKEC